MVGIPFYRPKPAPLGVYDGQPFPWAKANIWAKINISFVTDFFKISHGRAGDENGSYPMHS